MVQNRPATPAQSPDPSGIGPRAWTARTPVPTITASTRPSIAAKPAAGGGSSPRPALISSAKDRLAMNVSAFGPATRTVIVTW
jgi:hypothetical protein